MTGPETTIERKCVELAEAQGYALWKIRFTGRVGFPDRMLVGGRRDVFLEFKAPGAKPRPSQDRVHEEMRELGLRVEVIDSVEAFEGLLDEIQE